MTHASRRTCCSGEETAGPPPLSRIRPPVACCVLCAYAGLEESIPTSATTRDTLFRLGLNAMVAADARRCRCASTPAAFHTLPLQHTPAPRLRSPTGQAAPAFVHAQLASWQQLRLAQCMQGWGRCFAAHGGPPRAGSVHVCTLSARRQRMRRTARHLSPAPTGVRCFAVICRPITVHEHRGGGTAPARRRRRCGPPQTGRHLALLMRCRVLRALRPLRVSARSRRGVSQTGRSSAPECVGGEQRRAPQLQTRT